MSPSAPDTATVTQIRGLFKQLDADKNGTLSFDEMRLWLTNLNPKMSESELQQLFLEIDVDKNGVVQVDEFIDYVFFAKKADPTVEIEPPQGELRSVEVPAEWKESVLVAHNEMRALHGVPPLEWSEDCYREAKVQVDACQAEGKMFHGHPLGYLHGQNIYWCSRPGSSARAAVRSWHSEIEKPGWDFENPPKSTKGCGHFTQVVWRTTTHVGMASSEDGRFLLANYSPPGNWVGKAAANVPPILESMRPKYEALRGRRDAPLELELGLGLDSASSPSKPKPKPKPKPTAAASSPRTEAKPSKVIAGTGTKALVEAEPDMASDSVSLVTIEADSMTPELEALLGESPFKHGEKVAAAFARGGADVSVTRERTGRQTAMTITIKEGCKTTKMRGSWGCADR